MKRTLLSLAALLALSIGYVKAQTSAGNMMLGGGIRVTSESRENNSDYKNSSFSFSPDFGYFVADNFAVGLSLSIGTSTVGDATSKTVTTSTLVGPYARYYMFTSSDRFAFFGQASILIGSGKSDTTPGGVSKGSSLSFAVSPGFAYFFNDHWALDLRLQGISISSNDPNKDADNDKRTRIDFGVSSLSPTLGIRYHFGGN